MTEASKQAAVAAVAVAVAAVALPPSSSLLLSRDGGRFFPSSSLLHLHLSNLWAHYNTFLHDRRDTT